MEKASSSSNDSDKNNAEILDKTKKMNVKASPATLLAKNAVLLPTSFTPIPTTSNERKTLPNTTKSPTASGSATGNPRNKTALAPGHSLMDWIRLGNSGVDLTGVGGVSQSVSLTELSKHNKPNDAWLAIRGVVFNVSRYIDFHPGGAEELMKGVGKDATKLFDNAHPWVNYQSILQKCVVGKLTKSSGSIDTLPNILSSCSKTSGGDDAASDSKFSSVKFNWKQSTYNITTLYIPKSDERAVNYRLSRINDSTFELNIHLKEGTIVHKLQLAEDVKWCPKLLRDVESERIEFTFAKHKEKLWKSYGTYTSSLETDSSRRIYREYKLISNRKLCQVVHLLILRSDNYLEAVPPGRHVEVKMNIQGTEVSRMYTPVPGFLHPDDVIESHEADCMYLMVKRYEDGALTPSLTGLKPGDSVTVSAAIGKFCLQEYNECTTINMLAAGTGLTPMLSIIQRCLCRPRATTLNLLNFDKDENNIFYFTENQKICTEQKLKVTHILSQPSESWNGRRGCVSLELLKELVGNSGPQSCTFLCGPKGFMEVAKKYLVELDWPTSKIHIFDN